MTDKQGQHIEAVGKSSSFCVAVSSSKVRQTSLALSFDVFSFICLLSTTTWYNVQPEFVRQCYAEFRLPDCLLHIKARDILKRKINRHCGRCKICKLVNLRQNLPLPTAPPSLPFPAKSLFSSLSSPLLPLGCWKVKERSGRLVPLITFLFFSYQPASGKARVLQSAQSLRPYSSNKQQFKWLKNKYVTPAFSPSDSHTLETERFTQGRQRKRIEGI